MMGLKPVGVLTGRHNTARLEMSGDGRRLVWVVIN